MADWQAGDLALCVGYGPDPDDWLSEGGPTLGSIHKVLRAQWFPADTWNPAGVYLSFAGFDDSGYNALAFRKVTPPAADEFDRETIALMNGNRVGEPA